nr:hypothetical protein [Halegenticoccus tardaugens]
MTVCGPPTEAELLTTLAAVEVAGTRDEVHLLREAPLAVGRDNDGFAGVASNFAGASAAGKPHFRIIVVPDDRGIDVAVPVDLRAAEEADVNPAGLKIVAEPLSHRHDALGVRREYWVADGEGKLGRVRINGPRLVDHLEVRCVGPLGEVAGEVRDADADQGGVAVP